MAFGDTQIIAPYRKNYYATASIFMCIATKTLSKIYVAVFCEQNPQLTPDT